MRPLALLVFLIALGFAAGSCGEDDLRFPGDAPENTPTPADTATPSGTATPGPTSTPTPDDGNGLS